MTSEPDRRRWSIAAAIAAAVAAAIFGARVLAWYWPYNAAGTLNELALAGLGLAAGLVALAGLGRRRWAAGVVLGAAVYAALSLAEIGIAADGTVGRGLYRYYLYSRPGCEFTARFPAPPDFRPVGTPIAAGLGQIVAPVLAEIETITSMRAECLPLDESFADGSAGARVAAIGERMQAWSRDNGVNPGRIEIAPDGGLVALSGLQGGSVVPALDGSPGRTAVEVRIAFGQHSAMALTVTRPSDRPLSSPAAGFLASLTRR